METGLIFRARTEKDAELFRIEWAEKGRRPPRTRLEVWAIITIAIVTLITWGIVALVG